MASDLFLHLKAEHDRLSKMAIVQDPSKQDLKRFYLELLQSLHTLTDSQEKAQINHFLLCWRTYVRQTGETEVLSDEQVEKRRPRSRLL